MSTANTAAADGDVAMVDAQTNVVQEEVLYDKRLDLLNSLSKPQFQWQILTDEYVADIDANIGKLAGDIYSDFDRAEALFYEVIYSAKYHEERLPIDKLSAILNATAELREAQTLFFKFISIFNTFKVDENLLTLIKKFHKLPSREMGRYLGDDNLVKKLNMINEYSKHNKDYIINNFVEQKKFNLLHEASEGYSKLIAFLYEVIKSEDANFQVTYANNIIERFIGHYNLDPTKVLDILLDLFIHNIIINYRFCLELLKSSQWWPVNNEADCTTLEGLNKGGNQEAAFLIGLKFKDYVTKLKDLPETMKFVVGILIKEGFISFGSVYKYIGPDEETMSKFGDEIAKAIDDEILKASANALALSGPLVDDEDENGTASKSTASARKDNRKANIPDAKTLNQKLQMLKSFLSVGLYWPSVYILTKYPFLVHAEKDIVPIMLRLFKEIVSPLKQRISVLTNDELKELKSQKSTAFVRRTGNVSFEEFVYQDVEIFKVLHQNHTNKRFIFFYREWSEKIPISNTFEDLFKISSEFLSLAGAKIGEDPEFISLLSRFGVYDLEQSKDQENYEEKLNDWFEYFRKYIFPATSVVVENSVTTSDAFELMSKFPIQWRYNLYGELVNVISKNNDVVRLNYSKAEKQTKDALKRITTENVKSMMRKFSKIAFANPLPSFLVIVTQVESYDNFSDLIVDAARFFTDYAWDVLPFVLLMRLTTRRQFVQSDGLNDAQWLQSLSTFIAKLAKTYASMDLTPILTYIIKGLHANNTIGLTILREIVNQMGGIQQRSNLSATQIQLSNSGESLQKSINKVIFDTRDECTLPALRLLNSLIKSGFLSESLILLFDFQKKLIEDSGEDAHFKVLSNQNDEIVSVLHTYIELIKYFLRSKPEVFKENITSAEDLIKKFGIDIPWVFELWRSHLDIKKPEAAGLADLKLPHLSPSLYTAFWTLSLYDINYDQSLYAHENQRFTDSINSVKEKLAHAKKELYTAEVRDKEIKLRKEREFFEQILSQIPVDEEKHKAHTEKVLEDVNSLAADWFKVKEDPTVEEMQKFFQTCIIPRALHSESDAIFTGKFLTKLFTTDVSKKLVSVLFDSDFLDTLIYTITPLESENLGFFLAEVLGHYEKLRNEEDADNDTKKLIFNWQQQVLFSIKLNIESENYMSRRNVFTLLKNLITVYPVVEGHGESVVKSIEKVSNKEERQDLKLASDAILAHIKSRSKKWIHAWEFYEFEEAEKIKAIEKKELLRHQQEERKQEAKRAEIQKQKQEREAELAKRAASRPESRPESRLESRPESRSDSRTSDADTNSDIRLRPRFEDSRDEEGDSIMDDFDKKDDEDIELENKKEKSEPLKATDNGKQSVPAKSEPVESGKEKKDEEVSVKKEKTENHEDKKVKSKEPDVKEDEDKDKAKTEDQKKPEGTESGSGTKRVDTYIPNSKPSIPSSPAERPDNRLKRRFKDVTVGTLSNDEIENKLKSIKFAIIDGDFKRLKSFIDDREVVRDLDSLTKNSKDFGAEFKALIVDYAKKIAGPSSIHVTNFQKNINKTEVTTAHFKMELPSRPQRRPLPPQEAITGNTSRPADKWGVKPPSGPASQPSQRREYNQGYRQASTPSSYTPKFNRFRSNQSSTNSRVPPPPPPPAPSSGPNQNNRRYDKGGNYRDFGPYNREKRTRR
ncbi:THO complex subunit [Wickerhamomyces ciferrii]|uniref:THO complex subunit 2 n=1 Tax=Wickerhamomyces ciferrii (strain ATCC 14091 / BCRC 22168 / CBS 111 / JCM 3599 / NBRC 0793 / NRRL Y-1031 F-60-10) TaxID=1206466 RepID=K0KEK6_WICCF|nr:THO complex subunit [Wickerhamomyces ciferrii]CCH43570.1 THO complex subunit [Wickerhamomyces ciferrii]